MLNQVITRWYQKPPQKKGLFGKFFDNIKEGMERDKQLQENIKEFQNASKKMEETDAIRDVKEKMSFLGRWKRKTAPVTEQVQQTIKETSETLSSTYEKVTESEVFKKSQEITGEISKSAQEAASRISAQGEQISKTELGQQASKVLSAVKEDMIGDMAKESRPYQKPEKLKKRTIPGSERKAKVVEADDDATNVVLHKDSKWQEQWKDFRDNNAVVTGIFSLKTKFDESDNIVIRSTRVVTEKISDIFSDVFSPTEMATTIQEITKIDPTFNKYSFMKELEFEIIPTVLEAYLQADMEILRDWCHDAAYNVLSAHLENNKKLGLKMNSQILDIREVDLAVAKLMEHGPVFVITFQAQQTILVTDKSGKVVEGGPDRIENINYVWALCRDQDIYDHRVAWKILEFAIQQATPYL